jgi:hypothetical protein
MARYMGFGDVSIYTQKRSCLGTLEKNKKNIHLSNAIGSMVLAFLAYSADFVIMVMKLMGWA